MLHATSHNRLPRFVSALVWALLLGSSANADAIFNDFGPGYGTALGGYCVDGFSAAPICSSLPTGSVGLAPGALFVSSGNFDLTQIDVSLSYDGGTNSAVISLFTDASNA